MSNNWKLREKISEEISRKLHLYPKKIQQLLFNRGIIEEQSAQFFLETPYQEGLYSPFLFKDMEKTVLRIWKAISENEIVYVYGDYDADAVTASAVLILALSHLGLKIYSYIPDRFTEGYGINLEALKKIKEQGASLIITVDCGTNAHDAAEFCKANNIDLIISDHHEILGEPPETFALINPKNPLENYPNRDLTGVGVAFKIACAILSMAAPTLRSGQSAFIVSGWEKWLLDLVAIGTVADCHSLLGENRILVKYGLKVLAKTKWIGLKALIQTSGLDFSKKLPDTYTLGFIIAPRLNAAGRLEHANIALNLLLEKNQTSAHKQALALEAINQKRQALTQNVLSEAREQALSLKNRKILLLYGKGWPKGVVGLVAGKIAEEFLKPAIVLEEAEDEATGSARTYGDFDILQAINFAKEHLTKYGGHQQAAGLTLPVAKIEVFYSKVLSYVESAGFLENPEKVLFLEAELDETDLTFDFYNYVAKMEPFGVGNLRPKFLLKSVEILTSRTVGASSLHTQYQLRKENVIIPGIAFNSAMLEKNFKVGDTVDVACELTEDGWNGRKQLKLRVVDMKHL